MATAELVVAFSAKIDGLEASLKRVTTRLDEIESKAQQTNRAMSQSINSASQSFMGFAQNINRAAAAFGVFTALRMGRDLVVYLDEVNQSLVRLQVVLGNSRTAAESTFNGLAQISQRTGAPLTDLVDQFTRFRIALTGLGTSNQQVQQLVETLANFGRVSGSRPQEMSNAILQLGQGLASGRLQGDELKSILENMPALALALANQLGVGVGELRKMGEEGRLTAENVFPALLRAGAQLEEQIKNIPLGVVQSFEAAKTSWTLLIRHIDQTVGASAGIAAMLRVIAAGGNAIRQATGGATPQETLAALDERERRLRAQLAEQRRQAETGVFERPNVGAPGMVSAPDTPSPAQMERNRREATAAAARTQAEINEIIRQGALIREDINDAELGQNATIAERAAAERAAQGRQLNRELLGQLDQGYRIRQEATQREQNARRAAAAGELRDEQGRAVALQTVLDQIKKKRDEDLAALTAGDRSRAAAAERRAAAEQRRAENERERIQRERESQVAMFGRGDRDPLRGFNEAMARVTATPAGAQQSAMATFIEEIKAGRQEADTLFGFIVSEGGKAAEALHRMGMSPQPALDAMNERLNQTRDLLIGAGVDAAVVEEALRRAAEGSARQMDRLREKSEKTFDDIAASAVKSFSGDAAGAIVDWASGAEDSFEKFAQSFLKNLAKMILELIIFKAIVAALGFGGISIPGITGPQGRMAGGPVRAGTPYIVGERQPELFVPGSSGYVYPNVPGGGGFNLVINQNAPGVVVDAQQADEQTVLLSVNIARQQAAEDFRRSTRNGYGPYAESLNQQYQVRRRLS